ncbi:unnamed protein product [Ectocarpus sp. 12 AP-2014]
MSWWAGVCLAVWFGTLSYTCRRRRAIVLPRSCRDVHNMHRKQVVNSVEYWPPVSFVQSRQTNACLQFPFNQSPHTRHTLKATVQLIPCAKPQQKPMCTSSSEPKKARNNRHSFAFCFFVKFIQNKSHHQEAEITTSELRACSTFHDDVLTVLKSCDPLSVVVQSNLRCIEHLMPCAC